jgi:DNA-binding NtrC family response regulator
MSGPRLETDFLVIEDNDDMVALLRAILQPLGFRVRAANSAAEGLAAFAARPPDLLCIDLNLPDRPGEEIFHEVRARHPGFPCAILTANDSVEMAIGLMRAGAADYIIKPVAPEVLAARIAALRDRLVVQHEWDSLRVLYESVDPADVGLVVGPDLGMAALLRRLSMIARIDAPVLIAGESGTGKERVARAIHASSRRKDGPFVAVNLGAVPVSLWESEFFGHVRGAFTDAHSASAGLIASAEGGTLFLDEIGECPLPAQAKLLRFLQEREYRPLGATKDIPADVRVLTATNRDLEQQVEKGTFREDLYYRINVIPIRVPPLRERRADITALAQHFVVRYGKTFEIPVEGFTPAALARLSNYAWPGNVRELENVVQRAVATASQPLLRAVDLMLPGDPAGGLDLEASTFELHDSGALPHLPDARARATAAFERRYLERVIAVADGNITAAATLAGMPRKTFWRLLQKHKVVAMRDGVASKPGRPRASRS